jgi:RimJ/RimL family protein N-acetyltransferase
VRIQVKNKTSKTKFRTFLLSLSEKTLNNFNPFGKITLKNIDKLVEKEFSRKDKIKFFTYIGNEIISYSYLTLFDKLSKKHNCILGIVIADNWQGKGYGKQICQHMIKTAWKKKLTKIWLTVFIDNIPAQKIYSKLGFELEGIFLDDEIINGKKRTVLSMAIFKDKKYSKTNRKKIWQQFN